MLIATLIQLCNNVVQRCFDVLLTPTPTLYRRCATLKIVGFCFNVGPQCWNNVDPKLKCWQGCFLNGFSKIHERVLHNSLANFSENVISRFISAYKKFHSSNHLLTRLIEEWKKSLSNKNILKAALTGLSETFDCILQDLLAAKLHANGLLKDAITFIYL